MVNHEPSDATSSQMPVAPKRKRQVACLDEQERRERKRAMDREAQRSLREKTKTRIADLEHTIKVLREKDSNGVTASLLSEIDALRAENERLKRIIESVRSIVGGDVVSRNIVAANGEASERDEESPPAPANTGMHACSSLPELPTPVTDHSTKGSPPNNANQPFSIGHKGSAEQLTYKEQQRSTGQLISSTQPILTEPIDLDGMNVVTDTHLTDAQDANEDMDPMLALQLPARSAQEEKQGELSVTFLSMMQEIFGPEWRSPSPIALHIGDPTRDPQATRGTPICPVWKRISEIIDKSFTHRSRAVNGCITARQSRRQRTEIGLLYLGIKDGWDTIPASELQQYPALMMLSQIDDLVFRNLRTTERLACAYQSLKLNHFYLATSKQNLEKVPIWLRPSTSRTPTVVDFFSWPTLRSRFFANQDLISKSSALTFYYPNCLRFDWPLAFEDSFYYDDATGDYLPNPLFELYTENLKYWMMDESFYEKFPEMRSDIEGDRILYAHV